MIEAEVHVTCADLPSRCGAIEVAESNRRHRCSHNCIKDALNTNVLLGRFFQLFPCFLWPGVVARFPRICIPKNRGSCENGLPFLQYFHRPPQKLNATPIPHKYATNCHAVMPLAATKTDCPCTLVTKNSKARCSVTKKAQLRYLASFSPHRIFHHIPPSRYLGCPAAICTHSIVQNPNRNPINFLILQTLRSASAYVSATFLEIPPSSSHHQNLHKHLYECCCSVAERHG